MVLFSFFPVELLKLDLTALELRVLLALYSFRDKNANTVWPSLESIAERAGIADKTQVSKVTGKLELRGLITKRKRGFTGGNVYGFAKLDESSNLEESSKMDKSNNLDRKHKPNLDESSNSNLDKSSKCKELTKELTIELTNKNTTPRKRDESVSVDYLISVGCDAQVAKDWLAIRKSKKLPLTATALKTIQSEADKAGVTLANAIEIAASNSWAGFKASWLQNQAAQEAKQPESFIAIHTDRSWADGMTSSFMSGQRIDAQRLLAHD